MPKIWNDQEYGDREVLKKDEWLDYIFDLYEEKNLSELITSIDGTERFCEACAQSYNTDIKGYRNIDPVFVRSLEIATEVARRLVTEKYGQGRNYTIIPTRKRSQ